MAVKAWFCAPTTANGTAVGVAYQQSFYSDAEIFPSAFRTLGLGKLVGQPTGGHVIGTSSVRLIDGSVFRVPRTGVYTITGVNMEKEGVKPDIEVATASRSSRRGQGRATR